MPAKDGLIFILLPGSKLLAPAFPQASDAVAAQDRVRILRASARGGAVVGRAHGRYGAHALPRPQLRQGGGQGEQGETSNTKHIELEGAIVKLVCVDKNHLVDIYSIPRIH